MRKILALMMLCVLLLNSVAFAEEPIIYSYDFDFNFHLDTSAFPFREREHIQGYADLLDLIELRGNLAWCNSTKSVDLHVEVIPKTRPESAISFRIFGIPSVKRITSPLFGEEAIHFFPSEVMRYAVTVREVFMIPLPYFVLLNPKSTTFAFQCLADVWNKETGNLKKSGKLSYDVLKRIAKGWAQQMEENEDLDLWISALVDPLTDEGKTEKDLYALPELLLNAAGGKALTIKNKDGILSCTNAKNFVLWEQKEDENGFEFILNIPPEGAEYIPTFSITKKETDGKISFAMDVNWNPQEGLETLGESPASRLELSIGAEGIPSTLPADSDFTAFISQNGYIVPQFSYQLKGSSKTNGKVKLALSLTDKPEAGPVLTVEGKITPNTREEPLEYTYYGVVTDYNILAQSYKRQYEIIDKIKKPVFFGLLDFLYELPVSSCQSIMDDLESYGILQTALKK